MLCTFVAFSLVLINSVVSEVDPDDEKFATEYLKFYHYISPTDTGNHNTTLAIEKFQRFFGLSITGTLDEETLEVMHKPRCGDPDVNDAGTRVRRYATRGIWTKQNLTYYLSYGKDMTHSQQSRIIARAFKYWSDAAPTLNFTRTYNPNTTDIKISFGRRRHAGVPNEGNCPYPFDGPGRVIAHAFFPLPNFFRRGRIHFDDDETFTKFGGKSLGWFWYRRRTIGLLYTAVHEIGHSLGLMHSDVYSAVMWPIARAGKPVMDQDDIDGINALYGGGGGGDDA